MTITDRFTPDGGAADKVYIVGGRETFSIGMVGIDAKGASSSNVHAPASNTAAVVTKAAVTGAFNVLAGIYWSYDGDPTVWVLRVLPK